MTLSVAETATLVHGYTMADIDGLTRAAVKGSMRGFGIDWTDRQDYAWHGIVELLYSSPEPPTKRELIYAGVNAVQQAATDNLRHGGLDKNTMKGAPSFATYWRPVAHDDQAEKILEKLALPQLLSLLTGAEYEAITALAVFGDAATAADYLGIKKAALHTRVDTGRKKIIAAWYAPEHPPAIKKADTCRYGHPRATHSVRVVAEGREKWRCRLCVRNARRRDRARNRS